jgi:hypothetical protein
MNSVSVDKVRPVSSNKKIGNYGISVGKHDEISKQAATN